MNKFKRTLAILGLVLSLIIGLAATAGARIASPTVITSGTYAYIDYGGGIGQRSNYYYTPGQWDEHAYDTQTTESSREVFQSDCNLVGYNYDIYGRVYVIFASNTVRPVGTNCTFAIQTDGNLVIYQYGHGAIWSCACNRGTQYGYEHVIHSDGFFDVLWFHPGGTVIWAKP